MQSTKNKIAIVHDVLIQSGGAERVLALLLKIFPSADVYTSINKDTPHLREVQKRVKKTWQGLPFLNSYRTISKLFIHYYWESLDLSEYNLAISSSDEFSSKSIITGPQTLHICYCYTPPRYLYPEYPEINELKTHFPFKRKVLLSILRSKDYIAAQRPDILVAISKTVQSRIQKYYQRDSVVIYPPVKIPQKNPKRLGIDDYYVFIGALDKRKGVDLAINVFNAQKKKLIVIGDGRERNNLEKIAGRSIEFTGFISEKKKIHYLKSARGFVFPSIDEDFGIAPVEAMAHGVPVIAFYSGGLRETIIDGETGIFFRKHTNRSLADALRRFEATKFNPNKCYRQAKKFSEKRFKREITKLIENAYGKPK